MRLETLAPSLANLRKDLVEVLSSQLAAAPEENLARVAVLLDWLQRTVEAETLTRLLSEMPQGYPEPVRYFITAWTVAASRVEAHVALAEKVEIANRGVPA